ncbi:MAG: diaminopimelate decarboxylase [Chlorobi bacterium]|nr:diaminopimelate decarboxylase [Chlorobiota bacterium]
MMKLPFERPLIKKINAGMPSKFGLKPTIKPIEKVDGIVVGDLLEKYGSPLFVISEQTIRETYREAKQAFETRYPKVQFAWSYKTNYMNAVCKIFHQEGSWAEVVSGMEYDKALHNGVKGSQIIFNGPSKSREDLVKAIENDSLIHIDHFDELFLILEIAQSSDKKPKVAIRVNMDTGIYPKWDRFGFNYENGEAWEALNRIMLSEKLELVGLHTHIGTYIMTAEAYRIAAAKLADLAYNVERKFKHNIRYIDLGGGFASKNTLKGAYHTGIDTTPTFEEYAEAISGALISSNLNPEKLPVLILETGRALIDDAGYILGTVIANKRLSDGRRSLIVDVGVNMLFTSFWYEHEIYPAKGETQFTEETTIYGPLCMNIDVLRAAIDFPVLKSGDNFVIKRVGAYNMTQWMQFIHNRPAIVLIDEKGESHLIREHETLETIMHHERLPEHLSNI